MNEFFFLYFSGTCRLENKIHNRFQFTANFSRKSYHDMRVLACL